MPGTETSPIYGLSIWAGPQASPWEVENLVQRAFEALIRASVSDRDLADAPGVCPDGAAYLVAAGSTGGDPWEGHAGEMAVALGTDAGNGWVFLPVETVGFTLWIDDEALRVYWNGATWSTVAGSSSSQSITIALSDLGSDLTTGAGKAFWDPPYPIIVSDVYAGVFEAPTGAAVQIDINEAGSTILSTPISIDAGELHSDDAAAQPVISDSAVSGRVTIDIDQVGSVNAGKGAQVTLVYSAA